MLFIVKAPKMSPSLTLLSNQNRKKAKSGLYWPLIKKNSFARSFSHMPSTIPPSFSPIGPAHGLEEAPVAH